MKKASTLEKFLKGKRLYEAFEHELAIYESKPMEKWLSTMGENADAIVSAFGWVDEEIDWYKVHQQWIKFLEKHGNHE